MVRVTQIRWNEDEYIAYGPDEIKPVYEVSDGPRQHILTVMEWPVMAKWIPNALVRSRELSVNRLAKIYGPRVEPPGLRQDAADG